MPAAIFRLCSCCVVGDVVLLRPQEKQHASILVPVYAEDGRRLHRFRQSGLKDIDLCMERARRQMAGLMPEATKAGNDATEQGTAVHAAIELCLQMMMDGEHPLSLGSMFDMACEVFDEMSEVEGFQWVKAKSPATVHRRIKTCLATWYDRILPELHPSAAELSWGPLVVYEDEQRIIELTGTIDYIDAVEGPADWKTSGREWIKWEHDRWDIQPTVYTWALAVMLGDPHGAGRTWPFTFHVMYTDGGYDKIVVYRHAGDWTWLKERVLVVAKMIEAELPEWPLNDNHALCSPTWCPAWATCKGRHYQDSWPKPSLPR
jgi:hypothetical protein